MNLDRIISGLLESKPGKAVAAKAGFPEATVLRRGEQMPSGPLVLGVVDSQSSLVRDALAQLALTTQDAIQDVPDARTNGFRRTLASTGLPGEYRRGAAGRDHRLQGRTARAGSQRAATRDQGTGGLRTGDHRRG